MAHWNILLCTLWPASQLGSDWQLVFEWIYLYINISFCLIILGLYFVQSWHTSIIDKVWPAILPSTWFRSGMS